MPTSDAHLASQPADRDDLLSSASFSRLSKAFKGLLGIAVGLGSYSAAPHFYRVEDVSMLPNLQPKDALFAGSLLSVERFDVVVFNPGGAYEGWVVKRVVGLAGETLEYRNNCLYINGKLVEEPFPRIDFEGDVAPVRIPSGYAFVMGDNREVSQDSRTFGCVPLSGLRRMVDLR